MNNYVGKICPFCKTALHENDDIVICSVCEMPHHKDCWIDNQGCTTFGCDGTITMPDQNFIKAAQNEGVPKNVQDNIEVSGNSHIYCTKCGAKNSTGSRFCSMCGMPMQLIQQPQTTAAPSYKQSVSNNNPYASYVQQEYVPHSYNQRKRAELFIEYNGREMDSDLALLIGKHKEYYIPKFNELKMQNKKSSWNWCAFLFAPYWMIYRKMYGYGAAVLAGAFLCTLLGGFFSIVALAGYIVLGVLANNIYMNFLETKLRQMQMLSGTYKSEFTLKNGGTNTGATIAVLIGYSVIVAICRLA